MKFIVVQLRYSFLLALLFFGGIGISQPITFEKAYQFWGGNMGGDLIQTSDNGYYIAGNQALNINWTNLLNIGVDSIGNMLWYNIVGNGPLGGGGGEWSQNSMVALSDSVIYTIGRSNVVTGIPNQRNLVLYCLNGIGDTLWTNYYDFTLNFAAHSKIILSSDSTLVVSSSDPATGPFVMKLNLEGDTIWTRYWSSEYGKGSAYNLIQTFDGGYAVTGTVMGSINYLYMFVLKLSVDGEVEWSQMYPPQSFENSSAGNDIVQVPDSGFIIAGRGSTYKPEVSFNIYDRFIVRTNVLGDTLWTYKDGGIKTDNINNILLENQKFITSGSTINTDENNVIRGDVEVKSFGFTGEIIWERLFTANDVKETFSLISTSDGGYALTGRVLTEPDLNCINMCVYLLKLDSMGCLIPDCHLPDTTTNAIFTLESPEIEITLYPNPASAEVNVSYDAHETYQVSLILHDLFGRSHIIAHDYTLLQGQHLLRLDINHLPSGVYVLNIAEKNNRFNFSHRLVVL